ncbi:glycosyltransferase family 39 protein [Halostella litorea]|uniref:glycosyltransferase family 39 protein n=1 Tax=Halostella litorea TaxID=2528831 RepID=UPI001387631B|nr:glycosyltransferase family 39 protein [Halostella litorea]
MSSTLVNPSVTLPLIWSALLFLLITNIGTRYGYRLEGMVGGGLTAALLFAVNAYFAQPIDPEWHALLAFQLSTVVAAALVAVFVYKLTARMYDDRVGVFAGLSTALATPVGFWATIPKRHSFSALFVVATLYCFYRSRDAPNVCEATKFRALSYVPVGLATWLHAPEGLILFVALGTVDVLTARSNDPRHLAVVGVVFFVSLLPLFITNALISGNPFEPPRALPQFDGNTSALAGGGGSAGAANGTAGGSSGNGGGGITLAPLVAIAAAAGEKAVVFVEYMSGSVGALLDPGRLFGVVVRSGHGLGLHRYGTQSVNLSIVESMPLAGILFVGPAVLYRRIRARSGREWNSVVRSVRRDPKRATDLLAVVYLSLLVVMYVPRLPIHVSFTVRYLHPLYPLCVYFLARLSVVRNLVRTQGRLLAASYAGFVVVGGTLFALVVTATTGEVGEAVQLHARVAITAAALVLYWSVLSTFYDGYERLGAVLVGFAGAVTTTYLFLSAFLYFQYSSRFALPMSRLVADWLTL